jgi:hypothetical protein
MSYEQWWDRALRAFKSWWWERYFDCCSRTFNVFAIISIGYIPLISLRVEWGPMPNSLKRGLHLSAALVVLRATFEIGEVYR